MFYELRVYEISPGKMKNIIDRFANITVAIFKKHGIKPLFFWENVIGPNNHQLIYLLEWESLDQRQRAFETFQKDPEWLEKRAVTEKDGTLTVRVSNTMLREVPSIMKSLKELWG